MRLSQTRSSSAQRAVAGDLELAERRHVDDPDALAHRRVLDRDPVVVRRPRPAEGALVLARAPPRLAGPEVVGALPAVLRPEHGAELLQPPVQRAQPLGPPRLRRVVRIALPVVVLVDLARARGGEVGIAVRAAEPPRRGTAARRPRPRRSSRAPRAPCRGRPRRRSRSARAPPRARSPRTPGIGPSSGFPSGVIASG